MPTYRRREENISWTDLDSEFICLNMDTGEYTGLRGPARDLWLELCRPRTQEELVATIVRGYVVDESTAAKDVLGFLGELRTAGLIEEN